MSARWLLAIALTVGVPESALQAQRSQPIEALMRRSVADSNDPMAHYQLAMGYWEKKKWDEAERSLRVATTLSPSFAEGWLALSVLAVERGERYWKRFSEQHGEQATDSALTQARLYQQRGFLSNPLMDLAMLGRFRAQSRVRTPFGIELYFWWANDFEKGVNALRQSRNSEAYEYFEKILHDGRSGDRSTSPWFILWHHGQAAARLGNFPEAIADFSMLTGRARAQESLDEPEEDRVARAFRSLLGEIYTDEGLETQTNQFRYMMGMLYYMDGKLDQATAVFQRALEFDVGLYQAHVQLARIYEARQQWPQAIAARRSAVATNPDDHTLLIDLGATLMKSGQLDEAMDVLDQAGELGPRDPQAPYMLALAAIRKQDYPAARTAFTRFLSLAPSSSSYQIEEARRRLAEIPPP
jgi:tetratricopeptide (TPR) repeat protein